MKNNLLKYFEKLPVELIKYILKFKKTNECLICKQNFVYNFYVKYINRNLCSYRCYICYFYGYTLCNSILFLYIIFSPILCTGIVFFKYYYMIISLLFLFLYIEQYFLNKTNIHI